MILWPGGSLGSVLGLWPLGCRYLVLSRPGRTEVLQVEESALAELGELAELGGPIDDILKWSY